MSDKTSNRRRTAALGGLILLACAFTVGAAGSERSTLPGDLVNVTNADSNTLTVIDPMTSTVKGTVNLTSFDEDPRPPFQFVTGGVMPGHAAMTAKPLRQSARFGEMQSDAADA